MSQHLSSHFIVANSKLRNQRLWLLACEELSWALAEAAASRKAEVESAGGGVGAPRRAMGQGPRWGGSHLTPQAPARGQPLAPSPPLLTFPSQQN